MLKAGLDTNFQINMSNWTGRAQNPPVQKWVYMSQLSIKFIIIIVTFRVLYFLETVHKWHSSNCDIWHNQIPPLALVCASLLAWPIQYQLAPSHCFLTSLAPHALRCISDIQCNALLYFRLYDLHPVYQITIKWPQHFREEYVT